MKAHLAISLASVVAARAYADDNENAHTHVVLPTAKIEGGTGKSEIDVSFDIAWGVDRTTDWRVTPTFHATADGGITTLFSGDGNGFSSGGAWQAGATLAYVGLPSLAGRAFDLPLSQRLGLVETCKAACATGDKDPFCDAFKKEKDTRTKALDDRLGAAIEARKKALATQTQLRLEADTVIADPKTTAEAKTLAEAVRKSADDQVTMLSQAIETDQRAFDAAAKQIDTDVTEFFAETADPVTGMCKKVLPAYASASKEMRDAALQLPHYSASAGLLLGQTRHKFLEAIDTDAMLYKLDKGISHAQYSFGMSFVGIPQGTPVTFELPVRLDSKWSSAKQTAKWCVPAGTVQQAGTMVPAMTCDEQPLGAPSVSRTLSAAAYVGAIDDRSLGWRVAVGPTFRYDWLSKAANAYELGFAIPFYVRTSLVKESLSGIVRLVPALAITHASDGTEDTTFLVTLAVLADRNMFPAALQ